MPSPSSGLPPFLRALLAPGFFDAPATLIETHISWVLLTGELAYKIKKPLDLGFLDFSTLEKRRFYCAEELRLNRRLAPQIYLATVPIGGTPEHPVLGATPAFEHALEMRRFPQEARLDALLANGRLLPAHVDRLAARLAEFHAALPPASADSLYGAPEEVMRPPRENFLQTRPLLADPDDLARLDALAAWTEDAYARHRATLAQRKAQGFIREGHGDLHLANIVLLDGEPTPFDCIEFNDRLRWLDIINEMAFPFMDFIERGHAGLGWRLLAGWLEGTGDYAGLELLRFYAVYRAMVRAKVAAIRAAQSKAPPEECRAYLRLAQTLAQPGTAALIITHGVSGSGKSHFSRRLLEALGAIHLRSDVERKRLFGLKALATSGSEQDSGLYTPDASERTRARLLALAGGILRAGYPLIVDATFLHRSWRSPFRQLAERLGVPFAILDFQAPADILRERVAQRLRAGNDASEATLAVLEAQLAAAEALDADERRFTLSVDTLDETPDTIVRRIRERFGMMA